MPGVFRDFTITWKGEPVRITPTLRLLRLIEYENVSLADVAVRTSQGRPPVSHLALILARSLQDAGVDVTDDEVYEEMMDNVNPRDFAAMVQSVLLAFAPAEEDPKKADPPPAPARRKAARKRGQ